MDNFSTLQVCSNSHATGFDSLLRHRDGLETYLISFLVFLALLIYVSPAVIVSQIEFEIHFFSFLKTMLKMLFRNDYVMGEGLFTAAGTGLVFINCFYVFIGFSPSLGTLRWSTLLLNKFDVIQNRTNFLVHYRSIQILMHQIDNDFRTWHTVGIHMMMIFLIFITFALFHIYRELGVLTSVLAVIAIAIVFRTLHTFCLFVENLNIASTEFRCTLGNHYCSAYEKRVIRSMRPI